MQQICAKAGQMRIARRSKTAQIDRLDKLQRAGRDFLMRLVAKHGLRRAVRLAAELGGRRHLNEAR